MRQFDDVFAWEYSDLKTYDKSIIQHKIPLEKDTIPFKQKLRPINPMLLPLIEKEIKKLLAAKIIVPLRFSKWVANLVVVRKKSGEIRLCRFQKLKQMLQERQLSSAQDGEFVAEGLRS